MRRHIFDENFPASAVQALRQKVPSVAQVGQDWGKSGWRDVEQILPQLHGSRATFHTLDAGLFKRRYGYRDYCLVYYDVPEGELAHWVLRFLRHRQFNTHAKRLGKVIKVSPAKIAYWELHEPQLKEVEW
jgi:hypothetical protein